MQKIFFFQTDHVPQPFRHLYKEHGYFLTDEFAKDMTNVLLSVLDNCEEYMIWYHSTYLKQVGFNGTQEYIEYLETHPDDMDALAVMLTVMLNRVHISVHNKNGQ